MKNRLSWLLIFNIITFALHSMESDIAGSLDTLRLSLRELAAAINPTPPPFPPRDKEPRSKTPPPRTKPTPQQEKTRERSTSTPLKPEFIFKENQLEEIEELINEAQTAINYLEFRKTVDDLTKKIIDLVPATQKKNKAIEIYTKTTPLTETIAPANIKILLDPANLESKSKDAKSTNLKTKEDAVIAIEKLFNGIKSFVESNSYKPTQHASQLTNAIKKMLLVNPLLVFRFESTIKTILGTDNAYYDLLIDLFNHENSVLQSELQQTTKQKALHFGVVNDIALALEYAALINKFIQEATVKAQIGNNPAAIIFLKNIQVEQKKLMGILNTYQINFMNNELLREYFVNNGLLLFYRAIVHQPERSFCQGPTERAPLYADFIKELELASNRISYFQAHQTKFPDYLKNYVVQSSMDAFNWIANFIKTEEAKTKQKEKQGACVACLSTDLYNKIKNKPIVTQLQILNQITGHIKNVSNFLLQNLPATNTQATKETIQFAVDKLTDPTVSEETKKPVGYIAKIIQYIEEKMRQNKNIDEHTLASFLFENISKMCGHKE